MYRRPFTILAAASLALFLVLLVGSLFHRPLPMSTYVPPPPPTTMPAAGTAVIEIRFTSAGVYDCPNWLAIELFFTGILPIFWLMHWLKARFTPTVYYSRCAKCGYDLRATPSRCPECGAKPKVRTMEEGRERSGMDFMM